MLSVLGVWVIHRLLVVVRNDDSLAVVVLKLCVLTHGISCKVLIQTLLRLFAFIIFPQCLQVPFIHIFLLMPIHISRLFILIIVKMVVLLFGRVVVKVFRVHDKFILIPTSTSMHVNSKVHARNVTADLVNHFFMYTQLINNLNQHSLKWVVIEGEEGP